MTPKPVGPRLPFIVLSSALAAIGCGDDAKTSDTTETPEQVCVPGTTFSCVSGTCSGRQHCHPDGTGFTPCLCDELTAGTSGAGTSGGAGASAGSSGDAGDGGGAGTTAGSGGSSGSSGSSGSGSTACAQADCVADAPAGFAGPIALYVGAAAPPSCSAAFSAKSLTAGADPTGDPATCSSCECTPASTTCASFLNFSTSATAGCGGTPCTTSVGSSCVEIAPPCIAGLSTASLETKLPSAPGTCTASTQSPQKSTAELSTHVVGCAMDNPEQNGCDAGEVCAEDAPGAPFESTLCVWKAGDVACPSGDYSDKRVYFRKLSDTRSCSACSCDGPDCSYSWKVYAANDTSCTSPIVSLSSENQCLQVNPQSDALRVGVSITGTGACAASGGDPTGGVSGTDPVTVCCIP